MVAIAEFKDLCIDAAHPARLGQFWTACIGLTWHTHKDGDGRLTGPTPCHTIWVNAVPEPKRAKHRVHFDVYARSIADLEAIGATVLRPAGDDRHWTVMADPEGGEFCAFLRPDPPAQRLHGVVVDSADDTAQARWWGAVFGVDAVSNDGWSSLERLPGAPAFTMDFVPVPEPKVVKNRVHWDVTTADPATLVAAGAEVLRRPDDEIEWHVMADPEGNEFCVFAPR